VTKRMRLKWPKCRVSGMTLRYIEMKLNVELLLLCTEMSQLRSFGHLLRMPPRRHPVDVFWACPTGKRPRVYPEHTRGILSLGWCENPQDKLEEVTREKDVWVSLLSLLPQRTGLGKKRRIMDGWHLFS